MWVRGTFSSVFMALSFFRFDCKEQIDQNKVNVESINSKYQYADDPYLAIKGSRRLFTLHLHLEDEGRDLQKELQDIEDGVKKEMDKSKKPKKSNG